MIKATLKVLGILLIALLLQGSTALAGGKAPSESIPKTGDKAWDTFSKVKKDWMLKLYDIVVEDRPDLKPIADESLAWRMKEMEYDTKKFQYMSEKRPELIVRDKGLGQFVRLDWFPEFSEDLSRIDPSFAELEKKVLSLKDKISKSQNWTQLEDFINKLSKDEKHKEKVKQFTAELAKVQKILAQKAREIARNSQPE